MPVSLSMCLYSRTWCSVDSVTAFLIVLIRCWGVGRLFSDIPLLYSCSV